MMYKIIYGLVLIQHSLPLTYSNLNNISRGHVYRFIHPASRVNSYKYSFFPSTIRMWNRLPNQVVAIIRILDSIYTVRTVYAIVNLLFFESCTLTTTMQYNHKRPNHHIYSINLSAFLLSKIRQYYLDIMHV